MSLWESDATRVVLAGVISKKIPFIAGRISSSAVAYTVLEMPSMRDSAGMVSDGASSATFLISG